MLNRLTKQERILIITMLTIIIWAAGIMLVIKPNIEKSSEVSDKLKTVEQEKQDLELKLASEDQLKEDIKAVRKEVNTTLKDFFPATQNYDVDQYLAKIWQANGLTISNVSVSAPVVNQIDYYTYKSSSLQYPLGDYAKSKRGENAQEATETEEKKSEQCEVVTANLALQGSQEQIKNFVNAINHDEKTLFVQSVSASGADGTAWTASVTVSFIAVDKYEE